MLIREEGIRLLRLEHIDKTFYPGTVNEKRAIWDVSLHLKPGDFATIIGSNGAGKSTLLNAIAGYFYVDQGSILLEDTDITFVEEYRRSRVIGRLFQDPLKGTAPHMTIEENLALAYLRGVFLLAGFQKRIRNFSESSCRSFRWDWRSG